LSIPREQRVSKQRPCPICGHKTWCIFTADQGVVWCGRESRGAFKASKEGWLHRIDGAAAAPGATPPAKPAPRVHRNFERLAVRWQAAAAESRIRLAARQLGVSFESLQRLGIGWASAEALKMVKTKCFGAGAWSFPLRDGRLRVVGVRLRTDSGRKFAVDGSDGSGLLIPDGLPVGCDLFFPEGPTDTAAMLSLGLHVAGRPNCSAGVDYMRQLIRLLQPRSVVVVGDNDEPDDHGRRAGQERGAAVAVALGGRFALPPPQFKDMRRWLQCGCTPEQAARWFKVAIREAVA
jgi:hypothetical protein